MENDIKPKIKINEFFKESNSPLNGIGSLDKIDEKIIKKKNTYKDHLSNKSIMTTFQEQKLKGLYSVPSFKCSFVITCSVSFILILFGIIHICYVMKLSEVYII